MKENYIISENIDIRNINEFINDYKEALINKRQCKHSLIKITFNIDTENNSDSGLVDPLFLSYLALFLIDFNDVNVSFIIKDKLKEKRSFSLLTQLEHFIYYFSLNNRIIIDGQYIVKETGEIKSINFRNSLTYSQRYTPPIFIKNIASIDFFFSQKYEKNESEKFSKSNELLSDYARKIINIINNKGFNKKQRNSQQSKDFINNLTIYKLSFIELTLYLLLINKKTYNPLSGKGITSQTREDIFIENRKRFKQYIYYVKEISKGLKELAKNIVEHSGHKGVITARVFSKDELVSIKGEDSVENNYLRIRDESFYLDINIIDFGKETIKKKYIENLEKNKNIATSVGVKNIGKDISIINSFKYQDFFLINKHFFELEHQQNKLISRYGLHHFTYIIKKKLNGFIKTSSQGEGVIIYENENNKDKVIEERKRIPIRGTAYNCIIPLKKGYENQKIKENRIEEERGNVDAIKTITQLSEYHIISLGTDFQKKGIPIYKYPYDNIGEELKRKHNLFKKKKYNYLFYLYEDLNQKGFGKKNNILLLNADELLIENEYDWTKFLSALNQDFKDIIVYNTNKEHIRNIKDLREKYEIFYSQSTKKQKADYEEYHFWSSDSRVLFYSKKVNAKLKEDSRKYYRYSATALIGKSVKEYNYVNKSIWRHHYSFNHQEGFFSNEPNELEQPNNQAYGNKLFINNRLIYFELIIEIIERNGTKLSLFEKSVQYSLNKEYSEKNKNSNNRGYKISNTHFRLGSKIHISDFYYAKRLFQNSFFTTPLAYKITDYLCKTINFTKHKGVSIIGYDSYSDFIASTVRNILTKRNNGIKVNNFIISKDGDLSRDYKSLHTDTIIIVPIASTFSTSIKIKKDIDRIIKIHNNEKVYKEIISYNNNNKGLGFEEFFEKKFEPHPSIEGYTDFIEYFYSNKENIFLNFQNQGKESSYIYKLLKTIKEKQNVLSYLNILLVGHKEKEKENEYKYFDDIDTNIKTFANKIKNDFNWEAIDINKQLIEVHSYNDLDSITSKQKYFIPLYSEWNKAQNCRHCFPDDHLLAEKCLIETNPSSVTPQIIFDFPKVKEDNTNNSLNFKGSLLYGNLKRNANRYLFFTKAATIINKKSNKKNIIKWLKQLASTTFKDIKNEKIVLVSPSSKTKSNFIDLVNEIIFEYTANSIIISLDEDYIENSESLYSDALFNAKTVIYVNDIMISNKSFTKVNNIIKYIRNHKQEDKGVDYCILLINRMNYETENNMLGELSDKKYFHYHTKICIPSIEEPNNIFPLEKERKRYEFLSKISSLDSVRNHFNNKKNSLKTIDINKISVLNNVDFNRIDDDGIKHKNKKLFQLFVLDAFYSFFEYKNNLYIHKSEINSFFGFDKKNSFEIEQSFSLFISKINIKLKEKHNTISEHNAILTAYEPNLGCTVLKIICGTPLIYYKGIKESAFKWVIQKLIKLSNEINNAKNDEQKLSLFIQKTKFQYSKIETLKFLLKRSVQLQSNFIISKLFYDTMQIILPIIHKFEIVIPEKNNIYRKKQIVKQTKKHPTFDFPSNECREYIEITSKEFIYYIISLTQELIYEHETKSIELENRINSYTTTNGTDFFKNIENGNFYHFLRLLKLENTELFYKFYTYYKDDRIKYSDVKRLMEYKNDPKYKLASKLIDKDNDKDDLIIKYARLCSIFNEKEQNKPNLKTFIEDDILSSIVSILGNKTVEEASLFVNYNKIKENIKNNNIFIFNYRDTNSILNSERLNDSFTLKMFNGIKDSTNNHCNIISNIEICKKDNRYNFRKGLYFEDDTKINQKSISGFSEFRSLSNREEYNLLFIRISDFFKVNKSSNTDSLYTQAILTVLLKKGKRVDERNLRLLLLLRRSISKYLKNKISQEMYTELIRYEERENTLLLNNHYLTSHFNNLKHFYSISKTITDFENSKKNDLLFELNYNVIYNKVTKYDKEKITKIDDFTIKRVKKIIEVVLKSDTIEKSPAKEESFLITYCNENSFPDTDNIKFPSIIFDSVLLQLLINIKQYTDLDLFSYSKPVINISFCIKEGYFVLKLTNIKDKIKIKSRNIHRKGKGEGIKQINEIIKIINSNFETKIIFIPDDNPNDKTYVTILKIPLDYE